MRLKALQKLDLLLSWSFTEKQKNYPLQEPLQEKRMERDLPGLREFLEKYSYFSPARPIIAKVTSDEKDIDLAQSLLKILFESGADGDYLEIAVAEALTKVLAYRDLKEGQRVHIPIDCGDRINYEPFIVDKVFDIWRGMPAFGLVPERAGISSILLFRGTDFSLDSERGWASLLSDLDIAGPGLSAFRHAQDEISEWLKKVIPMGKKAISMGFSLGGALAAYTYIYENASLSDRGSIAMCSPGVGEKVLEDWRSLPDQRKKGFISYVYTGDVVSKVGHLFGTVYCLSASRCYKPLTAHTTLICSEPVFSMALVALDK